MKWLFRTVLVVLVAGGGVWAQSTEGTEEPSAAAHVLDAVIQGVEWQTSGSGEIGDVATMEVPAGFRYTGAKGASKMLVAFGNPDTGSALGFASPQDVRWFAVFQFDRCGYVKDDEKSNLNADEILGQMKEADKSSNEERERLGLGTLHVVGWAKPPFYNPETNNLEWAVRLRSGDGSENINYRTKILGREGVMEVVLVCDESEMGTVVPEFQNMLRQVKFVPGKTYAEYRKGDKIAQYGLTGLILGGGVLAAAKSGLLGKFLKPILIGVLALAAFFKRALGGLFGKKSGA